MKAKEIFGLQVLGEQPLLDLDVLRVADMDGWFWIKKDGLEEEIEWVNPNARGGQLWIRLYRTWCNTWALGSDRTSIDKVKEELEKEKPQGELEVKEVSDGQESNEPTTQEES